MISRGEGMDISRLNNAMAYIENHLCTEIDMAKAASVACESEDSFARIFRALTNITLKEYIRKRRLTLAVSDIHRGEKIIDIALKYGYESADSFRRAFVAQHAISPSDARNKELSVNIYPPLSFHITIKGAQKMEFKIIEREETAVYGFSRDFAASAGERWDEENTMWALDCDHLPEKICTGYDGIWYGIWDSGRYAIARDKENVQARDAEKIIIPSGTYAVFTTEKGCYAGDALPKLRDLIFNSWLDESGYRQKGNYELEVYHLRTDRAQRRAERYYEIQIPIEAK